MQTVLIDAGDRVLLVDPGFFPPEIQTAAQAFRQRAQGRPAMVVLTHSDFDHIAGAPSFGDFPIAASSQWDDANELSSIDRLHAFDTEFYLSRPWSETMPRVPLTKRIAPEDAWGPFVFFHTQGHTRDGLAIVWESQHTAIVGDFLSSLEFPFVYTSFAGYERTLQLFRELFARFHIDCVVSQHGPAATTSDAVAKRIDMAAQYIDAVVEAVTAAIARGDGIDLVMRTLSSLHYNDRPIPKGIQHFHEDNVRLAWREFGGS